MTTYTYTLTATQIVEAFDFLPYKHLKMYVHDKFNGSYEVVIYYGEEFDEYQFDVDIHLNGVKVFDETISNYGNDFIYYLEQYEPDSVEPDSVEPDSVEPDSVEN
jgi:hypothetical protein